MFEKVDIRELEEYVDMELWLDQEGIEYRVTMGSSGEQLNLKECPRCGGSSYKVYLNRETGLGNCFHGSCVGEPGFSKFSFARAYLGDFKLAIENFKTFARESGWLSKRKTAVAVVDETPNCKLPASFEIPHKGKNIKYLESRGVSSETARYFNLRYCHEGAFYFEQKGKTKFQDYSRRVIIPVFNLNGELVTFQGRDITGKAEKKYLFPAGLPGTGRFLFNGQNAVGRKRLIMGEGAFDCIGIKLACDEDVNLRDIEPIGSFGKSVSSGENSQTSALVSLKDSGLEELTIMWDGEWSTLNSAARYALEIAGLGIVVRVAKLPPGKDPMEVTGDVVREAYYKATLATPSNMTKLLLSSKRAYSSLA